MHRRPGVNEDTERVSVHRPVSTCHSRGRDVRSSGRDSLARLSECTPQAAELCDASKTAGGAQTRTTRERALDRAQVSVAETHQLWSSTSKHFSLSLRP